MNNEKLTQDLFTARRFSTSEKADYSSINSKKTRKSFHVILKESNLL